MDSERLKLIMLDNDLALKTTIIKMNSSLNDIVEKNPQREDLIDSMTKSLGDLHKVQTTLEYLKRYFNTNDLVQYLQVQEISELKYKNELLEKEIKTIKANLEL